MKSKVSFRIASLSAAMVLLYSFLLPAQSVGAVSCSGNSCNGKDPIATGCINSAVLIKRVPMYDVKTGIIGIYPNDLYLDVHYSRTCGTNWVRFAKNPYGGQAYKDIQVAPNGFLETEWDSGYGSSYSMMVYAPGSTAVRVYGKLYDRSGVPKMTSGFVTIQ